MSLLDLATALKEGRITLAEWEAAMRDYLRVQNIAAMELAKGGRQFVTQADWGYMGSVLKKQYEYLRGFANDIANNPTAWLNGRLDARMDMYKESSYTSFEDYQRREYKANGFDEEMRVLGETDKHCDDCLEAAGRWEAIGTLPPIGDSVCLTNCKCSFEYRRSQEAISEMLFAPALNQESEMLFAPALNQ